MDIFGVLSLFGGLAMFLFGMDVMGKGLERQAGNKLQVLLEKLTDNPVKGFLLGLGVTAVIQSSSATTVMVVGFVNAGIMELRQAVGVPRCPVVQQRAIFFIKSFIRWDAFPFHLLLL